MRIDVLPPAVGVLLKGIVLGVLCTLACVTSASPTVQKITYSVGVFPHLPPRDLDAVFSPIVADLSKISENNMVLQSSTTYEKFVELLDNQTFDIVFVQPFDYVRMADKFGYHPIATRNESLSAILVVQPDSPIKTTMDLKGKTISLPSKTAAVSYLTLALLAEHKLKPGIDVKLTYHRSHVSCIQRVLIGLADACGSAAPAVRFIEKKMGVTLRTVGESVKVPHTLFAVHPRVPVEVRQKITQRILDWANSPAGQALLQRGQLLPFRATSDAEYNIVRTLLKN